MKGDRQKMGRLLIDYSKNTAPLQKDGGRERLEVGMSLRYHEPLMGHEELDLSASSLGSRGKVHPPNPSFPLQYLDKLEEALKDSLEEMELTKSREKEEQRLSPPKQGTRRALSPSRTGALPKASPTNKRLVTFRLPSIASIQKRRFETQKLHHSDSDISFSLDKTNHTTPGAVDTTATKGNRDSILSKDDTFAGASINQLSIATAPAATWSAKTKVNRESLEKTLQKMSPPKQLIEDQEEEEEEEDSDDEKRGFSSFLPTALDTSSPEQDTLPLKKGKKKKKKKQQPSLDEWFNKGSNDSARSLMAENKEPQSPSSKLRSKSPKRRRGKRAQLRRQLSFDDTRTFASLSRSTSQMSNSQRSLMTDILKEMSKSHPEGPRGRILPKRTLSFDESSRSLLTNQSSNPSLVSASANTRRGGRRPGNRKSDKKSSGGPAPTQKLPARSLSSDGCSESFRNLKGNSLGFMAGSRIRVRKTPPHAADDDDSSVASFLSTTSSVAPPRRRGRRGSRNLPSRTKSCEGLPSLLRIL